MQSRNLILFMIFRIPLQWLCCNFLWHNPLLPVINPAFTWLWMISLTIYGLCTFRNQIIAQNDGVRVVLPIRLEYQI
jgi:hypothetical protein